MKNISIFITQAKDLILKKELDDIKHQRLIQQLKNNCEIMKSLYLTPSVGSYKGYITLPKGDLQFYQNIFSYFICYSELCSHDNNILDSIMFEKDLNEFINIVQDDIRSLESMKSMYQNRKDKNIHFDSNSNFEEVYQCLQEGLSKIQLLQKKEISIVHVPSTMYSIKSSNKKLEEKDLLIKKEDPDSKIDCCLVS